MEAAKKEEKGSASGEEKRKREHGSPFITF